MTDFNKNYIILILVLLIILLTKSVESTDVTVMVNDTGTRYGFNILYKVNVTGDWDEQSSPICVDGIVYVNSIGYNTIWALNATTGDHIWNVSVGTSNEGWGGPVYYDGVIYDNFNNIWALNATNGTQIWNYTLSGYLFSQGAVVTEDYVVGSTYGSGDGFLVVLNRSTGEQIWNFTPLNLQGVITESPIYGDYLVIAGYSGTAGAETLFVYNITDGSHFWNLSFPGNGFWDASPIIYQEKIYAVEDQGKLYSINLTTGAENWNVSLDNDDPRGAPTAYNDIIYLDNEITENINDVNYNYGTIFYAFNATTGEQIWNYTDWIGIGTANKAYQSFSSSTISNNLIFFSTRSNALTDGFMYALNSTGGELLWKYDFDVDVYGFPIIANNGTLFINPDNWYLYAFDVGGGSWNWNMANYNLNRSSYCPDCITTFENVKVSCAKTNNANSICNVTNNYPYDIQNITFVLDRNVSWYNETGSLICRYSYFCFDDTKTLQSLSSTTYNITYPILSPTVTLGVTNFSGDSDGNFTLTCNSSDDIGLSSITMYEDITEKYSSDLTEGLGNNAWASSTSGTSTANKAIDNSAATSWQATDTTGYWIIDMGDDYSVKKVNFQPISTINISGNISLSTDNITYTPVSEFNYVKSNIVQTYEFDKTTARYVMINITASYTTTIVRLREVEIFDFSQRWGLNDTILWNGFTNSTKFNFTQIPEGIYKWNCLVTDLDGNTSFSSVNNTYVVDMTSPSVSLSLSDSSIAPGGSILISCSTTDSLSGVGSTSLMITKSDGSSILGRCNSYFTDTSRSGTYSVDYSATDNVGNSASATKTFTVTGGGSSSPVIFKIYGTPTIAATKETRWLSSVEPEKENILFFGDGIPGIETIQFELKNKANNVKISVNQVEKSDIDKKPDGVPYKYIKIDHENLDDENVKSAIITFNVDKKWIKENEIDKDKIKMNRYKSSQWNELDTAFLKDSNDSYDYVAETPGFSLFVITGPQKEIKKEFAKSILNLPTNQNSSNLFFISIIAILIIIIILGWFYYHTKKKIKYKISLNTKRKSKRKKRKKS